MSLYSAETLEKLQPLGLMFQLLVHNLLKPPRSFLQQMQYERSFRQQPERDKRRDDFFHGLDHSRGYLAPDIKEALQCEFLVGRRIERCQSGTADYGELDSHIAN